MRCLLRFALILIATVLTGCASAPTHPSLRPLAQAGAPPAARSFFANTRATGNHQISPDGRQLAWVAAYGTGPALWVRSLEPAGVDRVVATGVIGYIWAADSRHVLAMRDRGGNENTHVMVLDTADPAAGWRDLTPHADVRAVWQLPLLDDTEQVLVHHNRRDRRFFDLYRVNLRTGAEVQVFRNPGTVVGVLTDRAGRVVAHVQKQALRWSLHAGLPAEPPTRALLTWGPDDAVSPSQADADGRGLYLMSNLGRDRLALVHLDVASGAQRVVHEDPSVDLEDVVFHPDTGQPLLATASPDDQKVTALDPQWAADLDRWWPTRPRRLSILSASRDLRRLTVMVDHDQHRETWLIDRATGESRAIGQAALNDFAGRLGVTRPVRFAARDGLPLHGYLTRPVVAPVGPGPLVLLVHGGPWDRDRWDNGLSEVRFLASRGYTVLQVNYRGSSGYGRAFQEAGVGEFAGKMHDDLIDAVRWSVDQGIADPAKVAIVGGSYGGYAALVGLSFTPETFACGISVVGPADLVSLVEHAPPYWRQDMSRWHRFVGDPSIAEQRAAMAAKSPIHRTESIRAPLLVIQGANDVRVRQDHSDRVVAALRAQGKPVEYLLLSRSGHRYGSWGDMLRAQRATERFLAKCLGGADGGPDLFELAAWLL